MTALPLLLLLAQSGNPQPVRSNGGIVVSDDPSASEIGAQVLRDGGNAVDAAIATAFALAVTKPAAGNIGGGGFMLVRMADGRAVFIDYREAAPALARRDMYIGPDGTPTRDSLQGMRASGVPGTVAGMAAAFHRFGSTKWPRLVEPARKLAAGGFTVTRSLASSLKSPALAQAAETKRIYQRSGKHYQEGEILRLPDLGRTLARIRDHGAHDFYEGETARLIDKDMRTRGGTIRLEDLRAYKAKIREPLKGSYRGATILTSPPPSSGGIAILQMLGMLEELPVQPYGSADHYHQMTEAMKLAFADRSEYLGDPDFVQVPTLKLLDTSYISSLRRRIRADKTTPSADIKPGLEPPYESPQTMHFSVVDRWGNCVANTYTLNTGFGSGEVIVGTGVLMNNEMDDFAAKPGSPNTYGLIQGEKNAIAPGKRPLSSMTPTIVLKERKPYLVLGSPGGPTIINTVLEVLTNVVDHQMGIREAVLAPRFHHQWLPDILRLERAGFSPDTIEALESKGHKIERVRFQGVANCIQIDLATGQRLGAPDTREPDATAVAATLANP